MGPLYKRLYFCLFYRCYLTQCDVYGIHKHLSMDFVWEKERKKLNMHENMVILTINVESGRSSEEELKTPQ